MATKKELVAELVTLGANEDEIKDLKNTELEALLEKAKEASIPAVEVNVEEVVTVAPVTEEVKADETVAAEEANEEAQEEVKGEVVRETSQQLGIFKDYIYNVRHKDAVVVVENLGYGDAYVDTEGLATVGKSERLSFKESAQFKGVEKLYFASASQPVIQIVEVK